MTKKQLQSVKNIRIEIQDTAYRKQELQERAMIINSKNLVQLQVYIEDKYESLIQLEKEFHLLVDRMATNHVDRQILRLHYLEGMSFSKIELWLFRKYELILSENAIEKRHKKLLSKITASNTGLTKCS